MNGKQVLEKARHVMRFRHMSYQTEKVYLAWIASYARWCARNPGGSSEEKCQAYLTELAVKRNVAAATQRQALNALVFLYRHVLQIDLGPVGNFTKTARAAKLPVVLDQSEVQATGSAIQPLLALVLYLCSDEPEIDDSQHPGEQPGRAKPKRTKKGWRLFPPPKPRIWTVGEGVGTALRREIDGEPTGRSVRPHLRRAHWHGFWTGPRDGERRFRYKWLPPTVVAGVKK